MASRDRQQRAAGLGRNGHGEQAGGQHAGAQDGALHLLKLLQTRAAQKQTEAATWLPDDYALTAPPPADSLDSSKEIVEKKKPATEVTGFH